MRRHRSGLLLCAALWTLTAWAADAPTALVQTQPIEVRALSQTVSGYGVVTGLPAQVHTLNVAVAGRIREVLVQTGQRVRPGQTLLRLEADPSARLAYTQAENALAYARQEWSRQVALRTQHLATNAQVDAAHRALQDAQQAVDAQVALGSDQPVIAVRAPTAGVLSSLTAVVGDRVQAGAVLGQVVPDGGGQVRVGLLPEEAHALHNGLPAHLVAVFDPSQQADGQVVGIDGQLDAATQRIDVTVAFQGQLAAGTRVKARINLGTPRLPAVPRQALLRDAQGAYIYQVDHGKAHRVTVQAGMQDDGWTAIAGAFDVHLPVVTQGNYELQDGMPVRESKP
jgi:RND family efflux transporter MFP subunit